MSPERKDDALRRRTAHWQLYAAITGSAMAMATNAGAGVPDLAWALVPSLLTAEQPFAAPASTQANAPTIEYQGVVPAFGAVNVIQPGEWVSIYGTNLAAATAVWNNDFPTSLGGTSVTINGRAAYLSMVSPGQINLQAPDDTASGTVPVVVTTGAGTASASVTLSQFSPSFLLLDTHHVAAIILRPDNSGYYGSGSYDILGPAGNCLGYYTMPAKAGDTLEIYGVGFGPTTPTVPAGKAFSGTAPINNVLNLSINNMPVTPAFVGLSGAGLYQINLVIPSGIASGDLAISASIGGMATQVGPVLSLQGPSATGPVCYVGDGGYTGDGGDGGDGGYGDGGYGGDGGDGGDGDGDGG